MFQKRFTLSFMLMTSILLYSPSMTFSSEPDAYLDVAPGESAMNLLDLKVRIVSLEKSLENLHRIIQDLEDETRKLKQSDREKFTPVLNKANDILIIAKAKEKELNNKNKNLEKDNEKVNLQNQKLKKEKKQFIADKTQAALDLKNAQDKLERKKELYNTGLIVLLSYAFLKIIEFMLAAPERKLKYEEYKIKAVQLSKIERIPNNFVYEHENCVVKFFNRIYMCWKKSS